MDQILLVEDDTAMAESLVYALEAEQCSYPGSSGGKLPGSGSDFAGCILAGRLRL